MRDASLILPSIFVLLAFPRAAVGATWTIPGVVKGPGRNGTSYVSDVVVTNPGTTAATVTWGFLPIPGGSPPPAILQPGQSLTVRDVVGTIFGLASQAAGALTVTSSQPLILRGRTYNTVSSGTFGVALPVVSDGQFFPAGYVAHSVWVQQDATTDQGYRTNIALVFPDEGGGSATVTLYDAGGSQMGQKQFSLTTAGFQQLAVGSFAAGPVPVGRAEMQVTSGRAAGYVVVVDNVTGDGSLFTFDIPPGGAQDVVVSGVARTAGALGTFWRTDGRIFNRGGDPATVTVSWNSAGSSNPNPPSATIAVPAGEIVDLPDVLSALFSLPSGSSGALRFVSDVPVAVACRTSNVDPTGARPGTYGSQQKPVPLTSYMMSADVGAVVTGIRQDGAFRTNVGFAAGADGASYSLTLKNPLGGTIGTSTASLGSFGWTQPNIAALFPGTSIPDGAQLLVMVTSGSLDVFDSSIDDGSGDPVVTPIAPLPVSPPSSATVGPQGGTIQSDDGRLTLKIPAGALSASTAFQIVTQPSDGSLPNALGPAYQVMPVNLALNTPGLLLLNLQPQELRSSDPHWFSLAFQSGTSWYTPATFFDPTRGTLTTLISSASPPTPARTPEITAQAGSGAGRFQGWVLASILPDPEVLDSGAFSNLSVHAYLGGNPKMGGSVEVPPTFVGLNITAWRVNGLQGGNDAVGHINPANSGLDGTPMGTYQAPQCSLFPPPTDPVKVSVDYTVTPGLKISRLPLGAPIYIVPMKWSIEIDMNETSSGSACVLFNTAQVLKGTFQLDGGGFLTNQSWEQPTVVSWSAPSCVCEVQKTADALVAAVIHGDSGVFDYFRNTVTLDLDVRFNGDLQLTLNCPMVPPVPVPTLPGPTGNFVAVFHPDASEKTVLFHQSQSSPGVVVNFDYTVKLSACAGP